MNDQELRIYSPTGIVGYGFGEESFQTAVNKGLHLIACDGGSTDPGPNYLGMGKAFVGRDAAKRDLKYMLIAGHDRNIPVIVGTSGTAGGDAHLAWTREIVEEIARENDLHFKMALIHSEQTKDYVAQKLEGGKVEPLWPMAPLTRETLDKSTNVVAMAGVEPYIEALSQGAQVILAGRSDDAAIFASLPIKEEFDPALGWTAGKTAGVRSRMCRAPAKIRLRGLVGIDPRRPHIGGGSPPGPPVYSPKHRHLFLARERDPTLPHRTVRCS